MWLSRSTPFSQVWWPLWTAKVRYKVDQVRTHNRPKITRLGTPTRLRSQMPLLSLTSRHIWRNQILRSTQTSRTPWRSSAVRTNPLSLATTSRRVKISTNRSLREAHQRCCRAIEKRCLWRWGSSLVSKLWPMLTLMITRMKSPFSCQNRSLILRMQV